MVNCGLHNRITAPPLQESRYLLDQFPHDVVDVRRELDIEDHRKTRNRLLWVYTDEADRQSIQTCLANEETIGTVLGYPECCVKRETERKRNMAVAFLRAIVDTVGTDPKKVRTALRDDLKVEVPNEIMADPNRFRTDQRYPFLLHTACDLCLQDDRSPSSRMNADNEALALDLDPEFQRSVSDIVALSCESAMLLGMDTSSWKEALTAQEQERLADLRNRSREIVQRLRGNPIEPC